MAKMPCRALVIRHSDKHPKARATRGDRSRRHTPQGTQGGAAQEVVQPGEHACPPGYRVLPAPNAHGGYCEPPGTPEAAKTACEHGMVGTPPNCHCPKNSELLGGNCVHYTETCRIGLAADSTPQPCAGAERSSPVKCVKTD